MYGWFSLPAGGYGGLHYIIPQAAAGCQAIRHIQFCAFRFSPASWWIGIRRSAPFVGRFSDPADRVTKPPRLVHRNHIPIFMARFQQLIRKRSHSTNQSKNRNRVGGVKTPPYGIANQITIPSLPGSADQHILQCTGDYPRCIGGGRKLTPGDFGESISNFERSVVGTEVLHRSRLEGQGGIFCGVSA